MHNDTAVHLLPRYGAHPVERFGALLVDTKHRLLRAHIPARPITR